MAKILIVEDEDFTLQLMTHVLKRAGHEVLIARDGDEGLAQVRRAKPDLVVMDMSMPTMTGWEAIRRLKGAQETKAIPILGLSAATTAEDRDEAYNAGCDAYEGKPIDIERVTDQVNALLAKRA